MARLYAPQFGADRSRVVSATGNRVGAAVGGAGLTSSPRHGRCARLSLPERQAHGAPQHGPPASRTSRSLRARRGSTAYPYVFMSPSCSQSSEHSLRWLKYRPVGTSGSRCLRIRAIALGSGSTLHLLIGRDVESLAIHAIEQRLRHISFAGVVRQVQRAKGYPLAVQVEVFRAEEPSSHLLRVGMPRSEGTFRKALRLGGDALEVLRRQQPVVYEDRADGQL
jgi:hypothetical protein